MIFCLVATIVIHLFQLGWMEPIGYFLPINLLIVNAYLCFATKDFFPLIVEEDIWMHQAIAIQCVLAASILAFFPQKAGVGMLLAFLASLYYFPIAWKIWRMPKAH